MRRLVLLGMGILVTGILGCEQYVIMPPEVEEGVSFADAVQPIFDDKCVSCHSGSIDPDLRAENAYEVLTMEGYVDTLDPESSEIYAKLQGGTHASRATEEEKLIILQWITEGAMNN